MPWLVLSILTFLVPVRTSVLLYERRSADRLGPQHLELKCDFDLDERGHHVNMVVISKDHKVIYSVEYFGNQTMDRIEHDKLYEKGDFGDLSTSNETDTEIEGWVSINIRSRIAGSYQCLVSYSNENSSISVKSNMVIIAKGKEQIKLQVERKKVHLGEDLRIGCLYELAPNDDFVGLSLLKDNTEFFRYYNDHNHTFKPMDGIPNITWSSYARKIYMSIKNVNNLTGGRYGCSIDYLNPSNLVNQLTLTDEENVDLHSSQNKIFYLPSLFMVLLINLILRL